MPLISKNAICCSASFVLSCFLMPALVSGQVASRTVFVDFEIESPLYRSQLPTQIDTLQKTFSAAVVDLLENIEPLSYIDWKPGDSWENDDNEQHHLHLVLEEKSTPLGSEIRLRFITHIAGALRNDLSNKSIEAFYPVVFRPIDSKYAQDSDRLSREIITWIEAHFDQSFQEALNDNFLRYAPLASIDPSDSNVKIDPALIIISTPINYADLYPDSGSKLKAIFHSKFAHDPASNLAGEVLPGHMYLRPLVDAGTILRVSMACNNDTDSLCFNYPGTSILSEAEISQKWTNIKSILDDDNLIDMRLFMEKYVKNYYPLTTGSIVNTP